MKESITKVNEDLNSVEISINAKGQWAGKVKVYAGEISIANKEAQKQATELEALIITKNKIGVN